MALYNWQEPDPEKLVGQFSDGGGTGGGGTGGAPSTGLTSASPISIGLTRPTTEPDPVPLAVATVENVTSDRRQRSRKAVLPKPRATSGIHI